jgi:hypothetical protein
LILLRNVLAAVCVIRHSEGTNLGSNVSDRTRTKTFARATCEKKPRRGSRRGHWEV